MKKILIIDDDRFMHNLCEELLVMKGYQIISAYDGEEGLEKIKIYRPDLILLDIVMPKMDGLTTLSHIRKEDKDIPVVIMSSKKWMRDDPEIQLCSQVYGFLEKPIIFDNLYELIRTTLQIKQGEFTWSGQKLGGCKLKRRIGRGGCGVVYQGVLGNQTVAVKILLEDILVEESILRLQREARSLVQLQHPNVIKLIDVGHNKEEKIYYIIMEYFSGINVQHILNKDYRLHPSEASEIIRQTALGMQAAHKVGLMHRDLKPHNLLYDRENHILKIIDFGMVRHVHIDKQITRPGYAIGTPYYMSPEQCLGRKGDNRSDIYSLGIIFYQLLTGVLPFEKSSAVDTLEAHIYDALTWPENAPKYVPSPFKEIIEKMLQKRPTDRYHNMQEIVNVLSR